MSIYVKYVYPVVLCRKDGREGVRGREGERNEYERVWTLVDKPRMYPAVFSCVISYHAPLHSCLVCLNHSNLYPVVSHLLLALSETFSPKIFTWLVSP